MASFDYKVTATANLVTYKESSETTALSNVDHTNAASVYGLSAAELLDRELASRGEVLDESWDEKRKATIDRLSHLWNKLRGRTTSQAYLDHLKSEYGGGKGYKYPHRYRKPKRELTAESIEQYAQSYTVEGRVAKRPYLDTFGRKVYKYEDVDVYLSPSTSLPRRLMVMATKTALHDDAPNTWRRTSVEGDVPVALKMAEWALDRRLWWITSLLRTVIVALPLQLLLALPGADAPWDMADPDDSYLGYNGYHWKWPKHAINPLDARTVDSDSYEKPQITSSKQRLGRPRQLVLYEKGEWVVRQNPPRHEQYVFISYHWESFRDVPRTQKDRDRVDQMAQQLVLAAGLRAYFRDEHCIAQASEGSDLKTADINRMCDVIRGASFVALLLPDEETRRMVAWGERLWTLPEGMLAPGNIRVYTCQSEDAQGRINYQERSMSKTELTAEFWHDDSKADDVEVRVLAEHYDGVTVLGRLELFSSAIAALSVRKTSQDHTGADMGYALMGLLHYRIEPDPSDDLFQVISRLSLANDSDRLIERLISLYPRPTEDIHALLRMLASKDQYHTHLWDINPRCEVVGIGDEPNTVILNECRAVPIRWKCFPRMQYRRHVGVRKKIAELMVRSGAWWMITGYSLAFTYAPLLIGFSSEQFNTRWLWYAILLFLGVGLILASFAPKAVKRLFGGQVLESAPHLVAFEGTMPKAELERIIFGSNLNRLSYEPSSTTFAAEARHKYIRQANEPDWIAASQYKETLPGHRIFTLVDTGNLSITIFQAKRPPTVAVITGSEGGMLRAVLCSWRFANDCHYRETVIRVPSSTWEQTRPAAWIKVCLQSQNDFLLDQSRPALETPLPALVAPTESIDSAPSNNLPPPPHARNHSIEVSGPRPGEDAPRRNTADSSTYGSSINSRVMRPFRDRPKDRPKKERKQSGDNNDQGIDVEPARVPPAHIPLVIPSDILNSNDPDERESATLSHEHYSPPAPSAAGVVYYQDPPRPRNNSPVSQPSVDGRPAANAHRRASNPKPIPGQRVSASQVSAVADATANRSQSLGSLPQALQPAGNSVPRKQSQSASLQEISTSASNVRRASRHSTEQSQTPQKESLAAHSVNRKDASKSPHSETSPDPSRPQVPSKRTVPDLSSSRNPPENYKPPAPPPQLGPLDYATPGTQSPAIRPASPIKQKHPLTSRYSAVLKAPTADQSHLATQTMATSAQRAEAAETRRLTPASEEKEVEHGASGSNAAASYDNAHAPAAHAHAEVSELESSEINSMVSPRIDFVAKGWEYWSASEGGADADSAEERRAS